MNISINASFLPHTDAEASLTFYRDVLGFEVRLDVGSGQMRWLTLGPAGQPDTSIVLTPAITDPTISDEERAVIESLMAKGNMPRSCWQARTSMRPSPRWRAGEPTSSRSRWTSPTVSGTSLCGIRPAI